MPALLFVDNKNLQMRFIFFFCFSGLSNLQYLGAGENNLNSIPDEVGEYMSNISFYKWLVSKIVTTVLHNAARNCFLAFQTLIAHFSLLHGVFLENKMAGSNKDGFRFVNCEFK